MWKDQKKINKEILRNIGLVTQLGLVVISSLLIFFFVFLYLDNKFQTKGVLSIAGVLLGVSAGILGAYRLLKRVYQKDE